MSPPAARGVDSRALPLYAAGAVPVSYVIDGMDELVARETVWEPHAHPTHELLWNLRGASSVTVGDRTWAITPTTGLWLPAGTVHTARAPAGTWYRAAQFGVHAVRPLADAPVGVEVTPLLALLLERLRDAALAEDSRALTERMVLDVLEPAPREVRVTTPGSALLRPVVAAVEADPGDPRALADWAAELGVSARTLTRAFRAETGQSLGGWQAAVRVQRAVLLLAAGERVEDVADAVGYRSASAFGAAFRRQTGRSPSRFQPAAAPVRVPIATGDVPIA
ncbi:helix-turn-helix domain-containing protein [Cellulomonas pakistanensis]|uniref:AraC family transcriptional regulator n=1 Tax=Cellulomonas pakistanensis TaxID=992287 RepID=A0A919PDQ2_9CELL|nr:AraC family transcriptional regulator [Cellulomonas pakistanensis]GIG37685.1 AraC family transcriptional regulator [Cellulomonas pakistanensis]